MVKTNPSVPVVEIKPMLTTLRCLWFGLLALKKIFATSGKCARSINSTGSQRDYEFYASCAYCSKFPQVRYLRNKQGVGGGDLVLNSHFKFSILINKLSHLQAAVQ